jgi:hypothetical protein
MISEDGYPTPETLYKIISFDPFTGNLNEFIEYIMDNWVNGYHAEFDEERRILKLSTGGWSGCESVINALKDNESFWVLFWYSTTRGGHYEFRDLVDKRVK